MGVGGRRGEPPQRHRQEGPGEVPLQAVQDLRLLREEDALGVDPFLWILAGAIFSIYVQNWGNYSATFGSVSAAVVLLLWMYNSAQILVLGAAFNAELEEAAKAAER